MRVEVGEMPAYPRPDLQHVPDPSERPTREVYDRFIWLVELIKRARCDDELVYGSHPFLAKDVLMSAILVRANEALLEIAEEVEAPDDDRAQISAWTDRGRKGLDGCRDEKLGLCLDYDLRADEPLRARTVAGFAPLVSGTAGPKEREALLRSLDSEAFCGHPDLRWPLPPSTSPFEARFHPRSYWRGPVWPVVNWLLWWSLERSGEEERAARLKSDGLAQLAGGEFGEYYEPFTGEALGSDDQSWTAAVVLDWLASEPRAEAEGVA
jgi:glycogen debranching enzyme